MTSPMPAVGFIGLGAMGAPMASNVARAGFPLTVHDARPEAGSGLVEDGASWAATPGELAASCDVVLLSLPGPREVQHLVNGEEGLLARARRGMTIVDLSTNSPDVAAAIAVAADDAGVRFLDAPVSGGVAGARKGALTIMVGGDEQTLEACRPLLEAIGSRIFHMGDVGAGNVTKLVNNMLFAVGVSATVEALVLGAKAGVDPAKLRDVVLAGSGASVAWDHGTRSILAGRLAPTFTVDLAAKDVQLAKALASDVGVDVPMAARALELLVDHRDAGHASEDVLSLVRPAEERAGCVVTGEPAAT